MRLFCCFLFALPILAFAPLNAQTTLDLPTGTSYFQNFDTTPGASGTAYPSGYIAYDSNGNTDAVMDVGDSDTDSDGNYNFGGKLGLLGEGDFDNSGIVLALANTELRENFRLSFKAENVADGGFNSADLTLEVSTSSPTTGYSATSAVFSTGGVGAPEQQVFIDVSLAGIDNRSAPVYIRWRYENTSFFGRGDGLAIDSVTLRWDVIPLEVNLGPDQTLCAGETLTLDPGVSTGNFLWTTGATDPTLDVNTGGTYGVEVSHPTGQTANDSISITVVNGPSGAALTPNPNSQGLHATGTAGQPDTICGFNTLIYDLINPPGYPDSTYGLNWNISTPDIVSTTSGTAANGALTLNAPGSPNPGIVFEPLSSDGGQTYELQFVIEDFATGCAVDYSRFIFVGEVASATSLPEAQYLCFAGDTALLNASVPEAVTYTWNTGQTDAVISVNTPGSYTVTLTSVGGCSFIDTVVVANEPHDLELGPATLEVCAGYVLEAGYQGEGTGSYVWQDGSTAPTFTVDTSGNYFVYRSTPSGCTQSDSIALTVKPLPTRGGLPQTVGVCPGDDVTLSTGLIGEQHLWSTGENGSFITVDSTGMYSVTITGGNGCEANYATEVLALPSPDILLPATLEVCEEAELSTGNPNLPHVWSTGATTPSITVNTTGDYSVTINNAEGCEASHTVSVIVREAPELELLTPPTVAGAGETIDFDATANTDAVTWLWDFGNSDFSNLPNAVAYSYPEAGSYMVVVTITEGACQVSDSVQVVIEGVLSRDAAYTGGYQIYPNPASDVLHISGLGVPQASLELLDVTGQRVWQTALQTPGGQARVQLPAHLANGLYVLRVGGSASQKLLIRR